MNTEAASKMLDLIVHPAFLVKDSIILQVNRHAQIWMIEPGTNVLSMIENGQEEYEAFSDGCLYLTISAAGQSCSASVTKMDELDVFVIEQEANQAELQAMALAAKELRAPLASVMTTADHLFPLLDQQGNDTIDTQIARINRGLFQMLRVIGNMSDAVNYASSSSSSNMRTENICAVLQEIFEKAEALVHHANIALSFENLPEPLYCEIDSEKIERALFNILSNAIKFTPAGGQITAKLIQRGSKLYLTVQDSGCGIPSNLLGNVYARYRREPAIEDTRFGLGLGMVLIHATAALHGGTVLIDQPAGQGTRITMTMEIRENSEPRLRTPMLHIDYAGERDHGLIELSETLPYWLYEQDKLN